MKNQDQAKINRFEISHVPPEQVVSGFKAPFDVDAEDVRFTVQLPHEDWLKVREVGHNRRLSQVAVVRMIIAQWLKEHPEEWLDTIPKRRPEFSASQVREDSPAYQLVSSVQAVLERLEELERKKDESKTQDAAQEKPTIIP